MSNPEEKLAGVDQALADLGKSDEEISEVRGRFGGREAADLQAVDAELSALSDGVDADIPPTNVHTAPTQVPQPEELSWDDDSTEIEVLDESDFVLLVDEGDLEELEKVGEDDAMKTRPPELPEDADEEDDGFFKKLFGGRRSRPPQP